VNSVIDNEEKSKQRLMIQIRGLIEIAQKKKLVDTHTTTWYRLYDDNFFFFSLGAVKKKKARGKGVYA
jgi:hypothetical protein